MKAIESEEFYTELKKSNTIENRIIDLKEVDLKNFENLNFINCVFSSNQVVFFENGSSIHEKNIYFKDCSFNILHFLGCHRVNNLQIENILKISEIKFNNCKINNFKFLDCQNINYEISFSSVEFLETFNFANNNFEKNGILRFLKTIFNKDCVFEKNTLCKLMFALTNFNDFSYFSNNSFSKDSEATFFICEFQQTDFSEFNIEKCFYNDCKFHGNTLFLNIEYSINKTFVFSDCFFEKNTNFNNSSFYKFSLINSKFSQAASLQDSFFDIITIDRTIFERGAFFDDIQIKKIDNCSRRTLRTIKQEIQKTENKIDYSRFRVYEFNAYKKDIPNKLNEFKEDKNRFYHRKREPEQLKRDLLILKLSDIVSEYGTDWVRALKFTLLSGLFFYSTFFLFEIYFDDFYQYKFANNYIQDFIKGFFRFFLLTDFYNPLEDGKTYIQSVWSWIPFIFGKIVIAFGIYEMIQSFRKFKA